MTLTEFYKELECVPAVWGYVGKALRCNMGELRFCPITAVCYSSQGILKNIQQFNSAARHLGLSITDTENIISASDFYKTEDRPIAEIRAKLLAATVEKTT